VTQHLLKKIGLSLGLLSTALTATAAIAQAPVLPAKQPLDRTVRSNARLNVVTAGTQTYTYTLLSYPGSLSTEGIGISPGSGGWGTQIVGAWNVSNAQTGFRASVWGKDVVHETYTLLNDPNAPAPQQPYSINDFGTIVGDYIDASGIFHGYETEFGGKFKPIEVPFAGAAGTLTPAINNGGEISGTWFDSSGSAHGFTLVQGVYTRFDYPGAIGTVPYSINSEGDIAGYYQDTAYNVHAFTRRRGVYTSIDYPGAVETFSLGINDAGDIVGAYCLTSQCTNTGQGQQGFLLRNGVYTSFAIPGEFSTGLQSINNRGVLLGSYQDATGSYYTFLATP
jgi:hypothetical protein